MRETPITGKGLEELGFFCFHGLYMFKGISYSPLNGWFRNGVKIYEANEINSIEQVKKLLNK